MGEALARPFDFSDLRITPDEPLKAFDAATVAKPREGTRPSKKDAYTDFLPPKPEAATTQLSAIPTLPLPETTLPNTKRKQEEEAEEEVTVFESKIGHFGLPFHTAARSEVGMTPHPQKVMADVIEDCTRTMAVGRELTAKTIMTVDHAKQNDISEEFDEKLAESIRIARENASLKLLNR